MKFKGKEIDMTWLSKSFKKGRYIISNSSGATFEYDDEEKRDKDYSKISKMISDEQMNVRKRILIQRLLKRKTVRG